MMVRLYEIFTAPEWSFLRYALLIGLLLSPVLGVIGTMVVTRRISSIAGAVSHAALSGFGISIFLQRSCNLAWCDTTRGATIGALVAAWLIGLITISSKEREDAVIGAIWALGMSVGLLFLDRTPGYVDWQGYLFGNILLLSSDDLVRTLLLNAVVLIPAILFFPMLLALAFDETFATLRGLSGKAFFFLLLTLTTLTIVQLINLVGMLLVIALLTLPAVTAGIFTRHLWSMMLLSALLAAIFIIAGLLASTLLELPSGPTIVVLAGIVYVFGLIWKKLHKHAD